MIETPAVVQQDAQPVARIRLTVPVAEIREVMGPGIQEVMQAVTEQGIGPAGPWFCHHFRNPGDVFDFEICVPVHAPVTPVGRVEPGERTPATVVRTVYTGPYERLHEAWREFDGWLRAHGHATGTELWEVYAVGPETSADPARWRTELSRPAG